MRFQPLLENRTHTHEYWLRPSRRAIDKALGELQARQQRHTHEGNKRLLSCYLMPAVFWVLSNSNKPHTHTQSNKPHTHTHPPNKPHTHTHTQLDSESEALGLDLTLLLNPMCNQISQGAHQSISKVQGWYWKQITVFIQHTFFKQPH